MEPVFSHMLIDFPRSVSNSKEFRLVLGKNGFPDIQSSIFSNICRVMSHNLQPDSLFKVEDFLVNREIPFDSSCGEDEDNCRHRCFRPGYDSVDLVYFGSVPLVKAPDIWKLVNNEYNLRENLRKYLQLNAPQATQLKIFVLKWDEGLKLQRKANFIQNIISV